MRDELQALKQQQEFVSQKTDSLTDKPACLSETANKAVDVDALKKSRTERGWMIEEISAYNLAIDDLAAQGMLNTGWKDKD